MDGDRTQGWLMVRVELALAVIAVLVTPILYITQPDALVPSLGGSREDVWARYYPIIAEVVMLLALAWMIRIWRGPSREAPPAWRYRDGE